MRSLYLTTTLFLLLMASSLQSQHVGIGTATPQRLLEIEGATSQYARIRTTSPFSGESGVELVRGTAASGSRDWSIVNDAGILKFLGSTNNFSSRYEVMRVTSAGLVGIGTSTPTATLHVDDGEEASAIQDGYVMLGDKSSYNLAIDNNEIIARYNGNGSSLILQPAGGDVFLQQLGGTTFMASGSGNVGVHTQLHLGKLNVRDGGFQMLLRNPDGADNDWHIGASDASWLAGDDQLLFSPSTSSAASILRLRNTADNNGSIAPVRIVSSASQALLIDGNEIDSELGPLYFNHNSNNNTYINPSGGQVGIGTSGPTASLHVEAPSAGADAISLIQDNSSWSLLPFPASDNLGFKHNGALLATVDGNSGQWIAISDRRFKDDIMPLEDLLDRLRMLDLRRYTFVHDPDGAANLGAMAQQVAELFPELVSEEEQGLGMSYAQLSVIALKALQEQSEQIATLKARLAALLQQ
ncbi:MAG: tail fiber domain-containing protein [Saprospiraceae bacterium]|nr:tail fiber domain-containing protein [Saprospiraceae bacterium]